MTRFIGRLALGNIAPWQKPELVSLWRRIIDVGEVDGVRFVVIANRWYAEYPADRDLAIHDPECDMGVDCTCGAYDDRG